MTNHIALYQPEIPANTGNIARTCVATDTHLHLIKPLGFSTDDKHLKRAGLDYWKYLNLTYHETLDDFLHYVSDRPLFLVSKFAHHTYSEVDYKRLDQDLFFLFGRETTGLPEDFMRANEEKCIRLPQDDRYVRCLNLSNCVAIVLYEALRQQKFNHLELTHHYQHDKLD